MNDEFQRLSQIIDQLRGENGTLKQNNYQLEMHIQQYASLDEKVNKY